MGDHSFPGSPQSGKSAFAFLETGVRGTHRKGSRGDTESFRSQEQQNQRGSRLAFRLRAGLPVRPAAALSGSPGPVCVCVCVCVCVGGGEGCGERIASQ